MTVSWDTVKYWCPECGCTATRMGNEIVCDDSDCTYTYIWGTDGIYAVMWEE